MATLVRERPAASVVQRALAVLDAVARGGESVSLTALAGDLGLPKPTAYRLLRELAEAGLVRRATEAAGGFAPGPRLESLALAVMQHSGSSTARHAILSRLVEELGETCNITVLDGSQVLYLDRVESPWPLRVHLQPGSRVPLTCTASGKLFLARLPRLRRDRLLAQMRFERHTERTLADRASLEQELERIRRQGFAVDNEEYLAGLLCVAVPVIDARGRAIAAVAVQAPVARLPRERAETTLPALERAAHALGATYGAPVTRTSRSRASASRGTR
jgi:DNA-binding IclR family transcriptional regulator